MDRRKFLKLTGQSAVCGVVASVVPMSALPKAAPAIVKSAPVVSSGIVTMGSVPRLLQEGMAKIFQKEYEGYYNDMHRL